MEDAPSLDRDGIGGNHPPGPIEMADETFRALSGFLAAHPAIVDDTSAREAKLFLDRANATKKDVEDAREREAKPLHAAWQAARAKYATPLDRLQDLIAHLKGRMTTWALAEEARRKREAAEAARVAEEARLKAEAALAAEREAIENAAVGDLEADVGAAVVQTDDAIGEARSAAIDAKRAERDSNVRIGGGFARASTLRTTYEYAVDDVDRAFVALWPNDDIREALLKAAREFERKNKKLPDGVTKTEVRKI